MSRKRRRNVVTYNWSSQSRVLNGVHAPQAFLRRQRQLQGDLVAQAEPDFSVVQVRGMRVVSQDGGFPCQHSP
jgi:hypothetical protein